MKKSLFVLSLFFLSVNLPAQGPDTLWTKAFGDSSYDYGSSIIQTNENTFIISGAIGTELSSNSYYTNIWLFGLDENGNELWSHNYGGMGAGEMAAASENEYFVAADAFNQGSWEDMQILKVNHLGDTIWTRTFYYSQSEYTPHIAPASDGGLLLLEYLYGNPQGALLIMLNASGDTLWTKLFSGYDLRPSSPVIDNAGQILFLVNKSDTTFLYKTDPSGNLQTKSKICSAPYSASRFLITEDGKYLMLGEYKPYDSSAIWVSCLDNSLNTLWSQVYFSSAQYSSPTKIIKSNTGGFLIIGNEGNYEPFDGTILKINDSGDLIWRKSYGGPFNEYFTDILILDNNEFFVVGDIDLTGNGKPDAWVLKFSADTGSTPVVYDSRSHLPDEFLLVQNFPNPFNPGTKIRYSVPQSVLVQIKVFDALGNEIETLLNEEKPAGSYALNWNAASLPSGVYFYKMQAGNFVQTKKMILLK